MGNHFVEHAAETPDVRFEIVRQVFPNFGGAVVGCSRLRPQESLLCDLRHIEVAELDHAGLGKEQVCALDVSVANF